MPPSVVHLKPGRERSLMRRHPWVFSGALRPVDEAIASGDTVEVLDHTGQWCGRGAYSPASQIAIRIWTFDKDEPIDEAFFRRRVARSIEARKDLASSQDVTGYREVHAESDGLPGVIVDRYAEFHVLQLLAAGAEKWRDTIVSCLAAGQGCVGVYERSDVAVRELEGLPSRTGLAWGADPPGEVLILEHGLRFLVDVRRGQKTGFYLDQRESRQRLRRGLAGADVLNAFAYTGGFTAAVLDGGAANVLSIDSSAGALELARRNVQANGLPAERCEWLEGDVFIELRRLRDRGRTFDAVILDPPRFAATSAQADRAARGYKDINLLGFKLLRPGGRLFTFSCSGGVSPELFEKIVAGAALDAGVDASIEEWMGQPADHPVSLNFPEGRYLKGLVCRVAA